jgi:hypothetical protein
MHVAAAVLSEDGLGEDALERGVLDVELDGLGGESDGQKDEPEIQRLIVNRLD